MFWCFGRVNINSFEFLGKFLMFSYKYVKKVYDNMKLLVYYNNLK